MRAFLLLLVLEIGFGCLMQYLADCLCRMIVQVDRVLVAMFGLVSFLASTAASSLCEEKCDRTVSPNVGEFCKNVSGADMLTNCCRDKSTKVVLGLDLSNCRWIDNVNYATFHANSSEEFQFGATYILDLTNTSITPLNFSIDALTNFVQLTELFLPLSFEHCPGGDEFWHDHQPNDYSMVCAKPYSACNISQVNCPEHGICSDGGPALPKCVCQHGFYGYKCWKEGIFPFALFFSILGASSIVMTVFLWYVGRRLISQHDKLN